MSHSHWSLLAILLLNVSQVKQQKLTKGLNEIWMQGTGRNNDMLVEMAAQAPL